MDDEVLHSVAESVGELAPDRPLLVALDLAVNAATSALMDTRESEGLLVDALTAMNEDERFWNALETVVANWQEQDDLEAKSVDQTTKPQARRALWEWEAAVLIDVGIPPPQVGLVMSRVEVGCGVASPLAPSAARARIEDATRGLSEDVEEELPDSSPGRFARRIRKAFSVISIIGGGILVVGDAVAVATGVAANPVLVLPAGAAATWSIGKGNKLLREAIDVADQADQRE